MSRCERLRVADLTLGVVGDEVWGGAKRHLPDRPVRVIGQVNWEDTDTQLTLGRGER